MYIDLATYPRRAHFELFRSFDYPHFNLTAPVDITRFQAAVKAHGAPFTIALMYLLMRCANHMPELRQRIRGEQIFQHETVSPAPTAPVGGDLFGFYHIDFIDDYAQFTVRARAAIERAATHPTLQDEPGRDDWVYLSAIPWVAFTGLAHPIHMHPVDSIPRISWGKFTRSGRRISMPLSVQVHHALMDGLHLGRYFEAVQAELNEFAWLRPLEE